jgi:multisubunit Na+/H+ antiporter MnhB subunit
MKTAVTTRDQARQPLSILLALTCAALALFLIVALHDLPETATGLTQLAKDAIPQSGVKHPVTAVLLNYRAYDTWLELGVLLMAVMGVLLFQRQNDLCDIRPMPSPEPVLNWLIRLIFPMMVLVAGYLLWMGKFAAGGAFQAGVVLGSGGVLLWLAGHSSITGFPGRAFRLLLTIGFATFLITAIVNLSLNQLLFDFPVPYAGTIILALEFAATLSISLTVATLIIGLQPVVHEQTQHP